MKKHVFPPVVRVVIRHGQGKNEVLLIAEARVVATDEYIDIAVDIVVRGRERIRGPPARQDFHRSDGEHTLAVVQHGCHPVRQPDQQILIPVVVEIRKE